MFVVDTKAIAVGMSILVAIVAFVLISTIIQQFLLDITIVLRVLSKSTRSWSSSTTTGGWLSHTTTLHLVEGTLLLRWGITKGAADIFLLVISILISESLLRGSLGLSWGTSLLGCTSVCFYRVSPVPVRVLTCALKVCGDSFTCDAFAEFSGDGCKELVSVQSNDE
jgi:hypothetical protein